MRVRVTPRGGTRACAVWRPALDRAEASPPVAAASSLDPDHRASARGRSFQAPPLTRERTRRAAFPDRPGSHPSPGCTLEPNTGSRWRSGRVSRGPQAVLPVQAIGITRSADHDRSSERSYAARLCPLCDLFARQLKPRRGDIPDVAAPLGDRPSWRLYAIAVGPSRLSLWCPTGIGSRASLFEIAFDGTGLARDQDPNASKSTIAEERLIMDD